MNNKELNEKLEELIEKNNDLLAQTKVLKDQLQVKHVVIDTHVKCQEKYAKLEAERYEYMIRYSAYFDNDKQHRKQIADQEVLYDKMSVQLIELDKHINFEDDYFQEIINLDFEKIDSSFQQTSSLKPYVSNVILEKIIIDLEDEVVNLLEKEKVNMETIESLKSKGFESSEKVSYESENQSENDCLVVEKECDKEENPKVIALGMFKLNLDTFSSVRRPKNSGVIWKKKGSSNTSNDDLSAKVYYVEGLGRNLFSVEQFCDKGLEVAFRKSTCFVRNEDGVDLLTGDHSSNLYTIALNKVASNSSTCLLAKASSSQSWLWHQRLSYLNFATINNLVKNNLVQGKSSSSSLNDDVQQSPEEVILPQTNTQSISNNMIHNVDEVSTSYNVFNDHLEDAYFNA
nr:ribonuclease H-like domain-containing protein [Tanacetum cinerariifolium]